MHNETLPKLISYLCSSVHQARTGVVMNILGIMAVSLALNTWGIGMFDLGTYPEWAHPINKSALATDAHLSVLSLNATH